MTSFYPDPLIPTEYPDGEIRRIKNPEGEFIPLTEYTALLEERVRDLELACREMRYCLRWAISTYSKVSHNKDLKYVIYPKLNLVEDLLSDETASDEGE